MGEILITGASGFVGSNLANYLKEKGEAYKKVSLRNGIPNNLFYQADAIIHLAGIVPELKDDSKKNTYYDVNTKLTQKLFDEFLVSNCKVFIFFSSVKAVAETLDCVLNEFNKPNPTTIYGHSKLDAENYILKKSTKGKKIFVLRPCMIYGPGSKSNLYKLYRAIKKRNIYPFSSFENKRSYTSIHNICFVVYSLLKEDIESGIYNISDSQAISTNKLIQIIGEVLEKPIRYIYINKKIIRLFAFLGNYIPIYINTSQLNKLTGNYEVSNNKIKHAISGELPVDIVEGIKSTIKSFKHYD